MPRRSPPSKPVLFEATRPQTIDARSTTKSYMAIYTITKELSHRNPETMIELLIPNSKGILHDIATWCEAVGNVLISSEVNCSEGRDEMHVVIEKGARRDSVVGEEGGGKGKKMVVLISTADLDYVVMPLERAISARLLGMDVSIIFESQGVRLLKNEYRAIRSGFLGGMRTAGLENGLREEGCPLPGEMILMLEELGAKFWICGPSMEREGLRREELIIEGVAVASTVTWMKMVGESDVCVFSKARLETT